MAGVPECEVLFEMFASPRGKVWLGRLETSGQASRIVLLRELNEAARTQITQAVETARTFTHPKLLKVLGIVSDKTRSFVASEYIPGVSLFELVEAIRRRQRPMATDAAVRIIIDVLRLVSERAAAFKAAAKPPARLLYAECIWIADFGEALLAEAGVSAHLVPPPVSASALLDPGMDAESQDVLTASVELFHLATGRLMTGDIRANAKMHLSSPLARVLEEVFSWRPSGGFDTAQGFATALSAMPPVLVGTEASVAEELRRLVTDLLDERRAKLMLLRGGSGSSDPEGPTRVYGSVSDPDDTNDHDDGDETTRAFQRDGIAGDARQERRIVQPELPLPPEEPLEELPAVSSRGAKIPKKHRKNPLLLPLGARAREALRVHRALVERFLLGVLVVLVLIAVALAVVYPSRIRVVVDGVKALH
jgi:hypothetical protein